MKTIKGLEAICRFDEYEKSKILDLTKGYPFEKRFLFIEMVQFICGRVLLYRESIDKLEYKRPSKTDHKSQVKDTIEKLEKTIKLLTKISCGKILPKRHYSLSELGPIWPSEDHSNDPIWDKNIKTANIATDALVKIQELTSIFKTSLKEYPDKAGSPGTINEEFVQQIAEAYRKYIDEPTANINDSFPAILRTLFECVGIKIDYPEKLAYKILSKK